MAQEMFGPYRLLRQLGRGGMGEVWEAVDTSQGDRVVALKVLGAWLGGNPDYARRFQREAALAARLNSPNIVPIHRYGEIDGQLYIDMALIDGRDLDALIETEGPLRPERAVWIIEQIADALDIAHHAGIVHRDVKPHNSLLTGRPGRDFAYLGDFGIARPIHGERWSLSIPAAPIGTPQYMSPEQFDGEGDHRADIYALGCVLCKTLTARPPFEANSFTGYLRAHNNDPPPRPSALRDGVPTTLDDVVARAMAKNPNERFAEAGALAAAARAALFAEAAPRFPTLPIEPTPKIPTPDDILMGRNWSETGAEDVRYGTGPESPGDDRDPRADSIDKRRRVDVAPRPDSPYRLRRSVSRRKALATLGGIVVAGTIGISLARTNTDASHNPSAGSLGKPSVQLSWIKTIEFGGEFFADSKGYYRDAGFESVDLVTGPVDSADQLVLAKNVTIGLSAPDATARFITEQGAPLKIIGSTFQKNPFCILSLEQGRPIRTPADLVGKTLGIQAGTNQQIFAGFLKANKIDPASLTQVVVQYEPTPLTEKKVDGFMAYLTNEPFLVKAKGFTPVTLAFADNGLPLTAETFVVLQDTIDTKRDMLKAFLRAEIRGWNDAVADPAGAAKLAVEVYGKNLGLDLPGQTEQAAAQNKLVVSADTKANGLFTLTGPLMDQIVAALGNIGITVKVAELFDMSLLAEVYAAHPELVV